MIFGRVLICTSMNKKEVWNQLNLLRISWLESELGTPWNGQFITCHFVVKNHQAQIHFGMVRVRFRRLKVAATVLGFRVLLKDPWPVCFFFSAMVSCRYWHMGETVGMRKRSVFKIGGCVHSLIVLGFVGRCFHTFLSLKLISHWYPLFIA